MMGAEHRWFYSERFKYIYTLIYVKQPMDTDNDKDRQSNLIEGTEKI